MTEDGQAVIDTAVANGTWQILPDAERETVPDDLQALFDGNPAAGENFRRFPPSSKRLILEWIAAAKKPDTRRRRIDQTVTLAAANIRANHRSPEAVGARVTHERRKPDSPQLRTGL
nr:YdeI/OmpD-associated family protein [Phytoactinopolyspora mesophila]